MVKMSDYTDREVLEEIWEITGNKLASSWVVRSAAIDLNTKIDSLKKEMTDIIKLHSNEYEMEITKILTGIRKDILKDLESIKKYLIELNEKKPVKKKWRLFGFKYF